MNVEWKLLLFIEVSVDINVQKTAVFFIKAKINQTWEKVVG